MLFSSLDQAIVSSYNENQSQLSTNEFLGLLQEVALQQSQLV